MGIATKHIPVVLGTARAERNSEKVAKAVRATIEAMDGYSTELVDVKDHIQYAVTVPPWGKGGANDEPTKWKEIVAGAHALVLVVPEYNHSFPGELKLLLDSLWDEYENKAVGLVGVSKGSLGAARVVDHIKPVLIELKLHPIREAVHLAKVAEAVTEDDTFTNEKTAERVETVIREVASVSSRLQAKL